MKKRGSQEVFRRSGPHTFGEWRSNTSAWCPNKGHMPLNKRTNLKKKQGGTAPKHRL
jgi:hypothetical protein